MIIQLISFCNYNLDEEFGEKTVSVLLDDEESELVFIDHPSLEMSVWNLYNFIHLLSF